VRCCVADWCNRLAKVWPWRPLSSSFTKAVTIVTGWELSDTTSYVCTTFTFPTPCCHNNNVKYVTSSSLTVKSRFHRIQWNISIMKSFEQWKYVYYNDISLRWNTLNMSEWLIGSCKKMQKRQTYHVYFIKKSINLFLLSSKLSGIFFPGHYEVLKTLHHVGCCQIYNDTVLKIWKSSQLSSPFATNYRCRIMTVL
jgi:hypothetical protein